MRDEIFCIPLKNEFIKNRINKIFEKKNMTK